MPTISGKLDAHLTDQTRVSITWAEVEVNLPDGTITTSLSAHLIAQTRQKITWAEIELTDSGAPVTVSLPVDFNAVLQKEVSVATKLSAYLAEPGTSQNSIFTSFDAALRGSSASRDLSSAIQVAIGDDQLEVFFAIDLGFSTAELNLWTGLGTKTILGKEYTGVGYLLDISSVEETSEMSAKGAKLVLSGIPLTLLSIALTEPYQGRPCSIYFGVESDTSDMTELFSGYMDQMNITESSETCVIELTVENKLVDLERPGVARYTSAYQKSIYPGDLGLDFVEDLQDKRLVWGRDA